MAQIIIVFEVNNQALPFDDAAGASMEDQLLYVLKQAIGELHGEAEEWLHQNIDDIELGDG